MAEDSLIRAKVAGALVQTLCIWFCQCSVLEYYDTGNTFDTEIEWAL